MSEATGAAPVVATPTAPVGATPPVAGGQQEGDVKAAAQEAARKLKIKYDDGNEEEVDEQEVLRTYRERKTHQKVASKELNEGKKLRQQAEEFVKMLKDPEKLWEVAKKLGHDPRKLSEAQLARFLEDDLMDPKEKELRDTRQKLEAYERQQKEAEEARQKAERDALTQKYAKEFETQFIDALKSSKLPQNKESVAKMAAYVQRCAKIGYKITPAEAARLVEQDIQTSLSKLAADADGEFLVKLLGEESLNKLRKYDTERLKNPMSTLQTPPEQTRRGSAETLNRRPTSKEWQMKRRGLA